MVDETFALAVETVKARITPELVGRVGAVFIFELGHKVSGLVARTLSPRGGGGGDSVEFATCSPTKD